MFVLQPNKENNNWILSITRPEFAFTLPFMQPPDRFNAFRGFPFNDASLIFLELPRVSCFSVSSSPDFRTFCFSPLSLRLINYKLRLRNLQSAFCEGKCKSSGFYVLRLHSTESETLLHSRSFITLEPKSLPMKAALRKSIQSKLKRIQMNLTTSTPNQTSNV